MQQILIENQKSLDKDSLIIFFAGFAQEKNLLDGLIFPYDTLYIFDYSDMSLSFNVIKEYKNIHVIAWSLGVFVAPFILSKKLHDFNISFDVAINGTIKAIDSTYGIAPAMYKATLDSLTDSSFIKFLRRICGSQDKLDLYMPYKCMRDINTIKNELIEILNVYSSVDINKLLDIKYKKALVSLKDKIFIKDNQELFFRENNTKVDFIDASHYDRDLFIKAIAYLNHAH